MLMGGGGMGELGLPWLGGPAPRLLLPALAYWYDGGRPSGCCGFIASEVDEAAGLAFGFEFAALVFALAAGVEACECDEVVLLAADEAVPLVVGAETAVEGLRLALEDLLLATD